MRNQDKAPDEDPSRLVLCLGDLVTDFLSPQHLGLRQPVEQALLERFDPTVASGLPTGVRFIVYWDADLIKLGSTLNINLVPPPEPSAMFMPK